MLLQVDKNTFDATRVKGRQLRDLGLKENDLQNVLFRSLDRLVGEDELLLIMQSRKWQEEPDLMALDREGKLYIFEIKLWESRSENILQALRYGQLNGMLDYAALDEIWRKHRSADRSLKEEHANRFEVNISESNFNNKQVFVVLTNGLDVKTRSAIQYWRSVGLDVRPWIYRSYDLNSNVLIEISPFRTADDPLEDQVEGDVAGYYIVNTNFANDESDDASMLTERKVAAYFAPWKFKIERLKRNDHIFLYRSGAGIVAIGRADSKLRKSDYHGRAEDKDEEYSRPLLEFGLLKSPIPAAEIKMITDNQKLVFRQTMFGLDPESGAKLYKEARARSLKV